MLQSGAGIKTLFCSADREPERYADELYKMLCGKYDVVHLHTSSWKRLLIEQIAVACQIPKIIVHSHNAGIDIEDEVARKKAEKIHYKVREQFSSALATDFCACSKAAADWLFGEQVPSSRIKILNNAINIEKFIYNADIREKYRHELGVDNSFVIGHIGRFSYQKNHAFLIDAFQKVCSKTPNVRLLLVGTGPLMDSVRKQAQQMKIADKIIFAGQRNDVANLLQAMDLFCLPSKFEGFPIVLIEAQAAGLKCLASTAIAEEVCVSSNIMQIPLCVDHWEDAIIYIAKGYVRKNMYDEMTAKDYNIKFQIKELERLYGS